ncbi:MAG: hypothetical protein K9H49_07825, partial [Bacteroidales bacterium]|nr:hypothetical protein [Bacteroidales bacterium]MCF8404541.1 hypothetical protein [Bacteroidales bacterium]
MKKFTFLLLLATIFGANLFAQETVYTVPAWDGSKIVNLCDGGTFTVYIDNSTSGHLYNLTIVDSKGLVQQITGNGGTISFNTQTPSFGSTSYTVFDGTDFSPNIVFTTNVVAQPTAPTLTKIPTDAIVCDGTDVSATIVAGSGGVTGCADTYEYSTDGGLTWNSYTSGQNISTTGLSTVIIQAFRSDVFGQGCMSSVNTVSWSVYGKVTPDIVYNTGGNVPCLNSSWVYTTQSGMTNYNWVVTNGTIASGSGTRQITVDWTTASGAGIVSVDYTDGHGCPSNTRTVNIDIKPLPIPTITGNDPVCDWSTETYTTESGQNNYDWEVTNGTITGGGDGNDYVDVQWQPGFGSGQVTVTYENADGCSPATPTIKNITINPQPNVNFTLNGNTVATDGEFEFCYDEDQIDMSIVNITGSVGTPPFDVSFTVNGSGGGSYTGVQYNDVFDMIQYLPVGPYTGQIAAGTYEIAITSFVDANGCPLTPGALGYYQFKIIINPQPDVFFTIDGDPLVPFETKEYCETETAINLSIVDEQGGNTAIGTPPYDLSFTINSGSTISVSDIAYDAIVNFVGYLPGTAGSITPGTYEVQVTSLTDDNGCALAPGALNYYNFILEINPSPVFGSVTLQYGFSSTGPWTAVSGDYSSGFDMCIHPDWQYFYLDVNTFSSTPAINAETLNPFYVVFADLPNQTEWLSFWTGKGVDVNTPGSPAYGIVHGTDPIFYLYKTLGGDYQIIDGYEYQYGGGVLNPLKIDGDYPNGNYHYQGSVISGGPNCASSDIDIWMEFNGGVMNFTQELMYCEIQPAINAAANGDDIRVAPGTYHQTTTLDINKPLTVTGFDKATTIIELDASVGASWGVLVGQSNTIFKGFTVNSNATNAGYVVRVAASPIALTTGITVEDLIINSTYRTGLDAHGVTNSTFDNIESYDATYGNGLSFTGCSNLNVDNITTCNNAWGGVAVYCSSSSNLNQGSDNLNFFANPGGSSFCEAVPFYTQEEFGLTITNITANGFDYIVKSVGSGYGFYDVTKGDAYTRALGLTNPENSAVYEISSGEWWVTPGLTIQAAHDAADAGSVINVEAGTYVEQVVVTKEGMSILGEDKLTTTIQSPVTLAWSFATGANNNFPVIGIDGVEVFTLQDITLDGANQGDANYRFIGIGFWNSGGSVQNVDVYNIMNSTFSGAQHGVGIYSYNDTGGPYNISLSDILVDDFQKTAIALYGDGMIVDLDDVTTIGEGPTSVTAQNGIIVGYGASGTINDCSISFINYTGGTWTASGMLLLNTNGNIIANNVDIDNCQTSVYVQDANGEYNNSDITNPIGDGLYIFSTGAAKSQGGLKELLLPSVIDEFTNKNFAPDATSVTFSLDGNSIIGTGASDSWGVSPYGYDAITASITNCTINNWDWGVVTYDFGGASINCTANENDLSGNTSYGFYSNTIETQNATCNWWGSDEYEDIFAYVNGPVVFTDYLVTSTLDPGDCSGFHGEVNNLNVVYVEAAQNIKVDFDVEINDFELQPVPGLDPLDPNYLTDVYNLYVDLQTALATGTVQDIQDAALAIGDDIITEYYYLDGANKIYLKTFEGNDLIKNKYWSQYLVREDEVAGTKVRYPNWLSDSTLVEAGFNYRTHTNPLTGTVLDAWLTDVLDNDLYISVTTIHNGKVETETVSVYIGPGPVENLDLSKTFLSIQDAIDDPLTIDGHTIEVQVADFTEPGQIDITKSLTIQGLGMTSTT